MFRLRLVLQKSPDRWVFRVGTLFRVINVVTAIALVAAGMALGSLTVPVVLASLAVLGALYEESATFDKRLNRVEFRLGLVLFHRTRTFALDAVAEVRCPTFGVAKFTGLEVGLTDGKTFTVENDRGKASHERLTAWGAELSQWLGVPYNT